MEVDFLLVGQGIAGSLLSYRLIKAGHTVHVIDQPGNNNCSRVAAGIYNPVTGRNLVKTWLADEMFPEIEAFYRELEGELGGSFLHHKAIYRPFASVEEQNEWMARSGEDEFKRYIKRIKTSPSYVEVNDPFGGLLLGESGYVDINVMLDHFVFWLEKKGGISQEQLDENQLKVSEEGIIYKEINAKRLVYSNGMGALNSKYFQWLPLIPNKGEILVIKQDFTPHEIINRGVFRLTLPDTTIKVGSTYYPGDITEGPTDKAREELLEKLKNLVDMPVKEIVEHKFGIRPTTSDRRPILGKHPKYRNVYMFNGLGAKGVSLAPYFSKIMLDLLVVEKDPPKEVNISRFFKYI
jgi:glycine oxidase